MLRQAVLVNGVPASGKSSIAAALARELGLPLLALDTVKEALFAELGTGDRLYNRRMGRASFAAIWALVAAFPPGAGVIVDAWFGFQPVDFIAGHIAGAGAAIACEIWCHAPPAEIGRRYRERAEHRHAGHLGADYAPELEALAARARPLGLGPVLPIDTIGPADLAALAAAVASRLAAARG
ncbi:AAA family ATPase [Acidisoma sp. C75]